MRPAGLFAIAVALVLTGAGLTLVALPELRGQNPATTRVDPASSALAAGRRAETRTGPRPRPRPVEARSSPGELVGGVTAAVDLTDPASVAAASQTFIGVAKPGGPGRFATLSFPPSAFRSTSYLVADAAVPAVPVFLEPGQPFPEGRTLANPTHEGSPLVMLVRRDAGEWLLVQIASRPNGAVGWVRRADVTLRTVTDHVVVERDARRLTLYRGTQVLRRFAVDVGAPRSPTPLGDFFVDAIRHLVPDDSVYGAGQLSVSGFSDVHRTWAGGPGQIALHGTGRPGLSGGAVSNGCVRLARQDLLTLLAEVPSGTPVSVVP